MKHPVLENRDRLIVWWLAWLIIALGQALSFYFAYGSFLNISIPDTLLSLLAYSGIALSLWYPFNYFYKGSAKPLSLIINLILTGAITVTAWVFFTKGMMSLILPEQNNYKAFWDATLPYRIGTGVFIYFLTILSYFLFTSLTNLSEKKAREARLESLVRETELKMLRSQINPHFLFNSLNSISSLTITNPEKARTMVIKLSDFMRYALSRKDEQPVSLRRELENLNLYLDIEKVRFGNRLITDENIDAECLEVAVPVLLLQPLYENAVKHGVYESIESVNIKTTARLKDGFLELIISNDFDPEAVTARGTGTGLQNVQRRLELSYGNRASIKTEKTTNLFTVTIYIPAENPKIS
jgi:two-component sensor histidine kinase